MSVRAPRSVASRDKTRRARFTRWRTEMSGKLARSSRVFLIGLIIACGIEVIVDWNTTIYEINVLRDGMRQRGLNYVSILSKAAVEPMLAYDADSMDALSAGLFDDQDVVFVRFSDQLGVTLYDRLRPTYAETFRKERDNAFRDYFDKQLNRDVTGILADPKRQADAMAASRTRDLFQLWNDIVGFFVAKFTGPKVLPVGSGVALYQDRLSTHGGAHDDDVTWALGTVVDGRNEAWGVALVAFDMGRTNAAINKKLLKGLGMVAFFVGLILVQNIFSRRDKLRLLDLETRYGNAKKAIRDTLPSEVKCEWLSVGAALDQAPGPVDGMFWDVHVGKQTLEMLVVDPDGDGIDAASTALHIAKAYRARRREGVEASMMGEAEALGAAALVIPLTRPIGMVLVRIAKQSGRIDVLASPLGEVRCLSGAVARKLETVAERNAPHGVVGPLMELHGELGPGEVMVAACGGMENIESRGRVEASEVSAFVHRTLPERGDDLSELAMDAATWARGKLTALAGQDVVILLARRVADETPD